jgi:hypothetical protein
MKKKSRASALFNGRNKAIIISNDEDVNLQDARAVYVKGKERITFLCLTPKSCLKLRYNELQICPAGITQLQLFHNFQTKTEIWSCRQTCSSLADFKAGF